MSSHPAADELGTPFDHLQILTCAKVRRRPTVTEFIDTRTGEIIDARAAQKMGVRSIRPDARIRRESKMNSLRKEPRAFAEFILKFRDGRCKFLAGLPELVTHYARMTGKAAEHVRRYLPSLTKAGVLDNDHALNEDFMIHNPTAGKTAAKGDAFRASCLLGRLRARFQGALQDAQLRLRS
jgi:hypothetical protein